MIANWNVNQRILWTKKNVNNKIELISRYVERFVSAIAFKYNSIIAFFIRVDRPRSDYHNNATIISGDLIDRVYLYNRRVLIFCRREILSKCVAGGKVEAPRCFAFHRHLESWLLRIYKLRLVRSIIFIIIHNTHNIRNPWVE